MTDVPRILVVCTGNLCRSPLVEALLRRELAAAGVDADVSSAGLGAPPSMCPDRRLRRVANELGVDVDEHRSRLVSSDDVRRSDLVLTMTSEQSEQVGVLDPSAADRVVTLRAAAWKARIVGGRPAPFSEWVRRLAGEPPGLAYDIADPIGGPIRDYRAMGDEVQVLVRALVEHWSGR